MTAPALNFIVTNAGRAAIINATSTGTDAVLVSEIGLSASNAAGSATSTSLTGEFKRVATIGGVVTAPDAIHVDMMDESTDAYTVRSIGIYLADGTLFAIYSQAGALFEKSAQAQLAFAWDAILADIAAATLTFPAANFLAPLATTEIEGLVEIATDAEAAAGTDPVRAITPKNLKPLIAATALLIKLLTVDGAGSGLDADLLDGRHASDFLLAANYTATDILAKLLNVDGSGSGLDADLLDGQHGSYYADVLARLGFTPVRQGGGTSQLNNVIRIGWDGSRLRGQFDATDLGPFVFDSQFTAASILSKLLTIDGSGSGLDADLLDGLNSTGFIKAAVDAWATSTDGATRLFFANNGPTYFGAGSGSGGGWYFQTGSVNKVQIEANGTITSLGGDVKANGTGSAQLRANGDVSAVRAGGNEGVVYLNLAGNRYLHFNGTAYYLPNADLYTGPAGGLVWTSANDGSGSGSDADMLDGYHASAFPKLATPNTFAGNISIDNGQPELALNCSGVHIARLVAQSDGFISLIRYNGGVNSYIFYVREAAINFDRQITVGGNLAWHAGNDGAGSGSDSDMLDGWHRDDIRSWMNLINVPGSTSGNGWVQLPNGIIFQWLPGVMAAAGDESTQVLGLPVTFPNGFLHAFPSTLLAGDSNFGDAFFQVIGGNQSQVFVKRQKTGGGNDNIASQPSVFVIGC